MADKKVLTVQDISCVGQCSLTVALPIISACGIETCILPSAVLSTHTAGFHGFTFCDLTDEMPRIVDHWEKEGIRFDAVYTGYLGSARQIGIVKDIFARVTAAGGARIVDPAMADGGKLYTGFDMAFAAEMAGLCAVADIILPNITEAAFMVNEPFLAEGYDRAYIERLLEKLHALGAPVVVLTGVSFEAGKLGVAVSHAGEPTTYYFHERMPKNSHGTGDIYASAFVGALMRGKTPEDAARLAADFTLAAMKATVGDEGHWYGTKFEKVLPQLISALDK